MVDKNSLGLISVLIGSSGYLLYTISILKNKTKPHLFTWITWSCVCGIVFAAQINKGAGPGAWAAGFSAVFCMVVVLMSLRYGEKKIARSDWIMFIGALFAVPLWIVTKDPLWSVVCVTAIDVMGFYPTIRKSYERPDEEMVAMYALDAVKNAFVLFALESYSVTTMLYPFFIILSNTTFTTMVLCRRVLLKKAK